MNAIVTVAGQDKPGIIAAVSGFLASHNVNIEDISQTVMGGYFSMIMRADLAASDLPLGELATAAEELGKRIGMAVVVRHEDIYKEMHRI